MFLHVLVWDQDIVCGLDSDTGCTALFLKKRTQGNYSGSEMVLVRILGFRAYVAWSYSVSVFSLARYSSLGFSLKNQLLKLKAIS